MIALLFLGFWALYILFAVFAPWFLFARAKRRKLLSVISSLLILFIPVVEYLNQLMAFKHECSKNIYFFPETKIEKPSALALSGFSSLNKSAYREQNGKKTLGLFKDFYVDHLVKVNYRSDFSELASNEIRDVIAESGEVYPYYKKEINEDEKIFLLDNVKYLAYSEFDYRKNLIVIRVYIFDIDLQERVSGISWVSHSKGSSDFHIFDPYEFGVCSPVMATFGYSYIEDLLIKTFN